MHSDRTIGGVEALPYVHTNSMHLGRSLSYWHHHQLCHNTVGRANSNQPTVLTMNSVATLMTSHNTVGRAKLRLILRCGEIQPPSGRPPPLPLVQYITSRGRLTPSRGEALHSPALSSRPTYSSVQSPAITTTRRRTAPCLCSSTRLVEPCHVA
jgi:hypothetical protein